MRDLRYAVPLLSVHSLRSPARKSNDFVSLSQTLPLRQRDSPKWECGNESLRSYAVVLRSFAINHSITVLELPLLENDSICFLQS